MNFPITFYKNISNPNPANIRRYAIFPKVKLGPTTLGIATIIIIMLMSLLYLAQANSTATKGYEIEKQQDKLKTLQSQSEKLELEMAKLRSTNRLNEAPEKLNLKPLPEDKLTYIQLDGTTAVAEKDGKNPKR